MLNLVNPNPAVRPEDVRLSLDEISSEGGGRPRWDGKEG